MGEMLSVYRVLVRRTGRKKLLVKSRRRWGKMIIRMDLPEIGWGGGAVDCIDMPQDRDGWKAVLYGCLNNLIP